MDEPLSNLDAKLRLEMRSELQRLHIDTGSTFIYVTHDQMEAMTLATKICLIDNGVLQQYDEPLNVYNRPVNLFAADFVGNPAINFIEGKGRQQNDGSVSMTILDSINVVFNPNEPLDLPAWYVKTDAEISSAVKHSVDKANKDSAFQHRIAKVNELEDYAGKAETTEEYFVIGIRPEFLTLDDSGGVAGEIYSAMPTGMETTVRVRIGDYLLTGVVFGGVLYRIGQPVHIHFGSDCIVLFSRKNGRFIAQGSLSE